MSSPVPVAVGSHAQSQSQSTTSPPVPVERLALARGETEEREIEIVRATESLSHGYWKHLTPISRFRMITVRRILRMQMTAISRTSSRNLIPIHTKISPQRYHVARIFLNQRPHRKWEKVSI